LAIWEHKAWSDIDLAQGMWPNKGMRDIAEDESEEEEEEEEEEEKDTIIGVEANNGGRYLGYAPTIPTPNGTYPPVVVERDGAVPWVLGSIDRSRGVEARNLIRLDRVMFAFTIYIEVTGRSSTLRAQRWRCGKERHIPSGRIAQQGGLPTPTGR
jgi:hypothetical protein